MKFELPAIISSTQDLSNLIIEIGGYARWFAKDAIRRRVSTKKRKKHSNDEPVLSSAASEVIRNWSSSNPMTSLSLNKLVKTLEKSKASASVIAITLAAPPTNEVKTKLVAWCRKNIAPDVMVSFNFNTTILGGMVVRSGSRIFDWSFKRQILAARESFPEVLRRV